jgi:hypothetical protein
MTNIFLEPWARAIVVLHAVAAMALVGASTHHALVAIGYFQGRFKVRLGRIYAATSAAAYGLTFALGAMAYPAYRYHVRGLYLDRHAVWASNLFDIKENLASLGLPLALGAFVLSRVLDPKSDRSMLAGYAVMVIGTAVSAWFNVVSGLLITMVKGV